MRIVYTDFLSDPSRPGVAGTSSTIWEMAGAARRLGHDVTIVAPYTSDRVPIPEIPVVRFSAPRSLYRNVVTQFVLALRGARVVNQQTHCDVVHCRDHTSSTALLLTTAGNRLVFTSPGHVYLHRRANVTPHSRVTTSFFHRFEAFTAKRCPMVIATSHQLADCWREMGIDENRLRLIPLGVNYETFRRIPRARRALQWSETQVHLLCVSRLSVEKGIPDLMRAAKALVRKGKPVHLHLVGEGVLRAELDRLASAAGSGFSVVFHEWVDRADLPLFYSAADVCVLPSLVEPFGRVTLEAMACGCLFVGANVGAARDHIEPGINGYVFDPGDVEELSSILDHVTELDPVTVGAIRRNGTAYVRTYLTWRSLIGKLINEAYTTLADAPR